MRIALIGILLPLTTTLWTAAKEPSQVKEHLFDAHDAARDRTVPIKVYQSEADAALPVILFSHGMGGSREGNPYLGRHWAEHGYIAVFMQHAGSDSEVWNSVDRSERMNAMKSAANLQATLNRFQDVSFVIDQLEIWNKEAEHTLHNKLDLDRLGLSGHSYGAVTTQALMGQKFAIDRSFHDPRIDAFIAMSPSIPKGISPDEAFGQISSPVLCMTGTKDDSPLQEGFRPESRAEVFPALPDGNKYHLLFLDAHHFAFSDSAFPGYENRIEHHHPAIQKISTRFWDAYLKKDPEAKAWLQSENVRTDCGLVEEDVWEWK